MTAPIRLSKQEIESITGVECGRPRAQCNRLMKMGIKAEVNARREVVCLRAWAELAALPDGFLGKYNPPPANDDDDDIGMNLGALDG